MADTRKHLAEQKMTAPRRRLLEHVPVSNLCDEEREYSLSASTPRCSTGGRTRVLVSPVL
jgi:hypothetical protein